MSNPTLNLDRARTLFLDRSGPLLVYDGELLLISDLNPEVHTRWRISQREMLRLGWRCIRAALRRY